MTAQVTVRSVLFRGTLAAHVSVPRGSIRIPHDELRDVADRLHEIADVYDERERNQR